MAGCPVLSAWAALPYLMKRASEGKISTVGEQGITRATVADNAEILKPIILHFGALALQRKSCRLHRMLNMIWFLLAINSGTRPSLHTMEDLAARFLYDACPRGKPLPTRAMSNNVV